MIPPPRHKTRKLERNLLYKQRVAYVYQVYKSLRSLPKTSRLLRLRQGTIIENCRAHERFVAEDSSFYGTPEGWEILRKRADAHVEGELSALRAIVALMKVECHRAGIDFARRKLLSEVGWEAFAAWRLRHRPPVAQPSCTLKEAGHPTGP